MHLTNWKSAGRVAELAPVHGLIQFKADATPGTFTGYASVWNVVDVFGEKVLPGAFTASLVRHKQRGSQVRMFWSHMVSEPIGRWTDLAEDKKGLYVEGRLNLEVNRAREIHALLKDGSVDGISIGYREREAERVGGVRELKELDLLEVSIVALPANPRATVDTVKSAAEAQQRFEEFCAALRDGKPRPTKEFEDLLREAGVPKSMATTIASVGYAKAIRSDSEGEEEAVMSAMRDAARAFRTTP